MSNFERAYKELFGMEGTYSVDKEDKGGETFCGVARNYSKDWKGWNIIDQHKNGNSVLSKETAKKLLDNKELLDLVYKYYKTKFWDIFDCDSMPYSLGLEVFEQCVNLGVGRSAKLLQQVLNAMNYKNKTVEGYGKDLTVDGAWGIMSKTRLKQLIDDGYAKQIQFGINCMQGAYYTERALSAPDQRVFYKGWIGQRTEAVYSPK